MSSLQYCLAVRRVNSSFRWLKQYSGTSETYCLWCPNVLFTPSKCIVCETQMNYMFQRWHFLHRTHVKIAFKFSILNIILYLCTHYYNNTYLNFILNCELYYLTSGDQWCYGSISPRFRKRGGGIVYSHLKVQYFWIHANRACRTDWNL